MTRERVSLARALLDVTASVAMLVAACAVTWTTMAPVAHRSADPSSPPLTDVSAKRITVAIDQATAVVNARSRAVVVEFSDFECPFCARHAKETLPTLWREFVEPGRVSYAVRHYPLERVHADAVRAAAAADCAARHGRFWDVYHYLFTTQRFRQPELMKSAEMIGVEPSALSSCIAEQAQSVRRSASEAMQLGVDSTPTFLIGTWTSDGKVSVRHKLVGFQSSDAFASVLTDMAEVGSQP